MEGGGRRKVLRRESKKDRNVQRDYNTFMVINEK